MAGEDVCSKFDRTASAWISIRNEMVKILIYLMLVVECKLLQN